MNINRDGLRSKFVVNYERLLQGIPPYHIGVGRVAYAQDRPTSLPSFPTSSNVQSTLFWDDLLALDINKTFLKNQLAQLDKDSCLGEVKTNLNELFAACLTYLIPTDEEAGTSSLSSLQEVRRRNALDTLIIFVNAMSTKSLGGWEIMEIYAGGVLRSDNVFTDFVSTLIDLLGSESLDPHTRHRALALALAFVCAANELSPGAYFLRQDLYPSLVKMMSGSEGEPRLNFKSCILLSLLANYHRTDAANLNPYLIRMSQETDEDLLRSLARVAYFRCQAACKAYQSVQDDSPPSLASSFSNAFATFTPDLKALASLPLPLFGGGTASSTPPATDSFSAFPPRDALILLPFYEYLTTNAKFPLVSIRTLPHSSVSEPTRLKSSTQTVALPPAVLSLGSYILTHATASGSSRAASYAQLTLEIIQTWIRDPYVVKTFMMQQGNVWLCRQRTPFLPLPKKDRPLLCSTLDCCILWLRHNLHKHLQASSHTACVYIINSILRFLHGERSRLEFHWSEIWQSLIKLLDYLWSKADSMKYISQVGPLTRLVVRTLALAVHADFLPEARDTHQLIYDLARAAPLLARQSTVLVPRPKNNSSTPMHASITDRLEAAIDRHTDVCLSSLLRISAYYAGKIAPDERSASTVMRRIAEEIGKDGVMLECSRSETAQVMQAETEFERLLFAMQQTDHSKFLRWACQDGMLLSED